MTIIEGDKVVLVRNVSPFGKLVVGETYEVCIIDKDNACVERGDVFAWINISDFDYYFVKVDDFRGWTPWEAIHNASGEIIGFFKTNLRKVEVRTIDNVKSSATCHGDEFNLRFGIDLAYNRCKKKALKKKMAEYEKLAKECQNSINDVENTIQRALAWIDNQ